MDVEGWLSGAGAEHDTGGLDKIANVEQVVEPIHTFLAKFVHAQE